MNSVIISLSLPLELAQALDEAVYKNYQNRSSFVREAIKDKINFVSKRQAEHDSMMSSWSLI